MYGQMRVSNELGKQAISVSAEGVGSIWLRHGLETLQKRLKAREGRYCYGKASWETCKESKHLAQSKMLDKINQTTKVVV
jgi:hypothetical protein